MTQPQTDSGIVDPMANRDGCEALLRGVEDETFDFLAEVSMSDEWAELLRAPLDRAAAKGDRGLARKEAGL